ncbi:MAG: D-alanyl-D-alanine carboxypeptidase/D-alanyl-D-alanine-endopeptidase [Bacteroidales bacterium]|nr:D-alanyl-D-alanine carboxypeptidase/D-alanyl-D-alanine-endopeptidase [Bacteroidales bacterium]MDD4671127.1 D-alanyl-D-alanine carboxypeptidase/D-alanyl-D-alanine-endopeptidase [Bacteroidales bacterium]
MIKKIFLALLLLPGALFAQNRVQNYVDNELKKDSLFINAVVGILAVDADGNEIASWNPDMPLLTASTMKTITTGVALEVLGPEYRFSTKIAYDGEINHRGVLKGNLYIVGGADPTLGSRDTIAYPIDSIFGEWVNAIHSAGIKKIDGKIVADDRFLVDETIPGTWQWGDLGYDYGSGASGLSFCENMLFFEIEAGTNVGDPVRILPLEPYSPYMTFVNEVTTGEKGDGENTSYYASDLSPVGKFTGTYGVDRRLDTIVRSNKYGPATCANAFSIYLHNHNIKHDGFADVKTLSTMHNERVTPQDSLTYIGETFSPELIEIVNVTNRISNNFFAETMLKTVGKTLSGRGSYYSSTKALKEYLADRGISVFGFTQDDGSGLSRENYVSTRFFCGYYTMMSKSATFARFFESLPGPGRPGTLSNVLKNDDPALKATIRAKSGSLSGVRCYAGYVDSQKGLFKFAILVNNYSCPTRMVQPKIEGFLRELAKYGAEIEQ